MARRGRGHRCCLCALACFGARRIARGLPSSATTTSSYQGIVDERLKQPSSPPPPKSTPRRAKSAPAKSSPCAPSPTNCAGRLLRRRRIATSPLGTYSESAPPSITVHPGPQLHAQDGATIHFNSGVVESITDDHGQPLSSYELEPLLITGLSEDANRTKRRLVTYDEIPPTLCRPCWPSKTAASSSTAASTSGA
jgi:penicillin-binding protein 1B